MTELERKILEAGGVKDKTVIEKTGKGWKEWFSILDSEGAIELPHKNITEILQNSFDVSEWWSQMISASYEKEKKLRKKNERQNGFEISCSKTCAVPVDLLYKAWYDDSLLKLWFDKKFVIRKSTQQKSIRAVWGDTKTTLDISFYSRGDSKSQVVVQHQKLISTEVAEEQRDYWSNILEKLKEFVEMDAE